MSPFNYRPLLFKEGYHVTHRQPACNIFRYNSVQKPEICLNLGTEATGLRMISPDCPCSFIPRRSRQTKAGRKFHTLIVPLVDTVINSITLESFLTRFKTCNDCGYPCFFKLSLLQQVDTETYASRKVFPVLQGGLNQ